VIATFYGTGMHVRTPRTWSLRLTAVATAAVLAACGSNQDTPSTPVSDSLPQGDSLPNSASSDSSADAATAGTAAWDGDPCSLLSAEQLNAPIRPGNNDYVYTFGAGVPTTSAMGDPACGYPLVSQGEGEIKIAINAEPANWEGTKQVLKIDEEYPSVGRDAYASRNCNCVRILADGFSVTLSPGGFVGNAWMDYRAQWAESVGENLSAQGQAG
jgi:hypothetical protein